MNIALKTTLALGAAGLSLLTLTGQVGAQTQTGDPALTPVFSTYNGKGSPNSTSQAIGLGFDPNNGGGKLGASMTQATAQSVYEPFNFTSSAAGTFSTLAAGSTVQLESFIANNNLMVPNNFDVYAVLYAYNPSAAAGTVPVTGSDLFGTPQQIVAATATGGYFSSDFKTTAALVAGQQYVFGFTTLNNDTQDFAQMSTTVNGQANLTPTDFALAQNKYLTQDDDQGAPTVDVVDQNNPNVLAFRLSAAPAAGGAPVPEASSLVSTALLLTLGGAFLAFKRRSLAK